MALDIVSELVAQPDGYEVLWDYCLENNIPMPDNDMVNRGISAYSVSFVNNVYASRSNTHVRSVKDYHPRWRSASGKSWSPAVSGRYFRTNSQSNGYAHGF